MNFKKLTIAAAIVAMTSLSAVAPVYAQAAAPAAPAAAPAAPAADAAAPAARTPPAGLNDCTGTTLPRQLEAANARLQGGIAFLGSVGSVSPFVGLLGTVMGILNALIGIGVAGQASIDKVAGPVGEALI